MIILAGTTSETMSGLWSGIVLVVVAGIVLAIVWSRMRRQVGGGLGPTQFSDGSMTTSPTGYPEEMKGHGKKISPVDNNAARM